MNQRLTIESVPNMSIGYEIGKHGCSSVVSGLLDLWPAEHRGKNLHACASQSAESPIAFLATNINIAGSKHVVVVCLRSKFPQPKHFTLQRGAPWLPQFLSQRGVRFCHALSVTVECRSLATEFSAHDRDDIPLRRGVGVVAEHSCPSRRVCDLHGRLSDSAHTSHFEIKVHVVCCGIHNILKRHGPSRRAIGARVTLNLAVIVGQSRVCRCGCCWSAPRLAGAARVVPVSWGPALRIISCASTININ